MATRPVAIPTTVGSAFLGKALFVPVEIEAIGTLPHASATTALVPSPPSTMIAATPAETIASTATVVPAADCVRI